MIDREKYFQDMGLSQDSVSRCVRQFEHRDDEGLPKLLDINFMTGDVRIIWKDDTFGRIHVDTLRLQAEPFEAIIR